MAVIIKKTKHFYTRFPLGLLLITFLAFSPIIIGVIGGFFWQLSTGESCHEGNCIWAAWGWLSILTIPFSGLILLVFFVVVISDSIKLSRLSKK